MQQCVCVCVLGIAAMWGPKSVDTFTLGGHILLMRTKSKSHIVLHSSLEGEGIYKRSAQVKVSQALKL